MGNEACSDYRRLEEGRYSCGLSVPNRIDKFGSHYHSD
jgi:hypothetical protein